MAIRGKGISSCHRKRYTQQSEEDVYFVMSEGELTFKYIIHNFCIDVHHLFRV